VLFFVLSYFLKVNRKVSEAYLKCNKNTCLPPGLLAWIMELSLDHFHKCRWHICYSFVSMLIIIRPADLTLVWMFFWIFPMAWRLERLLSIETNNIKLNFDLLYMKEVCVFPWTSFCSDIEVQGIMRFENYSQITLIVLTRRPSHCLDLPTITCFLCNSFCIGHK